MFESLLSGFQDLIQLALNYVMAFLPDSPFQGFIYRIASLPGLGYVNYFISFSMIEGILVVWLAAVGVYYMYQLILRWIKAVGS